MYFFDVNLQKKKDSLTPLLTLLYEVMNETTFHVILNYISRIPILHIFLQLNIPMNTSCVPGHELTKEPFRWDQRIFGLVLRLPGSVPIDLSSNTFIPSAENHPLDLMCEVTGGNWF